MIQNYISTFLLFLGIIVSILGWISYFPLIIIGYSMIIIAPFILNEKYELDKWIKEYLK